MNHQPSTLNTQATVLPLRRPLPEHPPRNQDPPHHQDGPAAPTPAPPGPTLVELLSRLLGVHAGCAVVFVIPHTATPDTPDPQPATPTKTKPRSSGSTSSLTARELEVLKLLADGSTNHQIAAALWISPKTASVHVSHILTKLGTATRAGAAGMAHRLGILEPDHSEQRMGTPCAR